MHALVAGPLLALICLAAPQPQAASPESGESLRAAATAGDLVRVRELLAGGTPVDAANAYGATALSLAANRGHAEIVGTLLAAGADAEAIDTFYKFRPLDWAAAGGHAEAVQRLLDGGARSLGRALLLAVSEPYPEVVRRLLAARRATPEELNQAFAEALQNGDEELSRLLADAGGRVVEAAVPVETLTALGGVYRGDDGTQVTTVVQAGRLALRFADSPEPLVLRAEDERTFHPLGMDAVSVVFRPAEGGGMTLLWSGRGPNMELRRVATPTAPGGGG